MRSKPSARPPARGLVYLALVTAPCLWGGNFVVGRAMGEAIPGVWLNLLRWVLAALILAPFLARPLWRNRKAVRRSLPQLALLSALGLVGFNSFLYSGLSEASVPAAALAFAAAPFLVVVLDALINGRAPSAAPVFFAILCLGGTGILLADDLAGARISLWAALMLAAAALAFSAYSVALRHSARAIPSGASFFAQVLIAIPAQLALALAAAPDAARLPQSWEVWASVLYVGGFAAAMAFAIWSEGMRHVRGEEAGAFLALVPVFAGLFGWLLLDDATGPAEMAALIGVTLSAIAIGWLPQRRLRSGRQA
ncbi:MAG: DMT family transporter [Pseudomonadota bacterium]